MIRLEGHVNCINIKMVAKTYIRLKGHVPLYEKNIRIKKYVHV